MLGHISIGVADLARSMAFYDAVLAPLGYVRLWTTAKAAGYGPEGARDEPLAIIAAGADARAPGGGSHLALTATSRTAVDEFHAVAMRMGATDEGGPGPRPQYGAGYYATFVRDLDGYKLEAVFHEP